VIGLVALTTAACVLSYSSVHDFALSAGISRPLARIYPDIGDAMLVMAGCSVLALRGAGLLSKVYGWLSFILLLGALAASSVMREAGFNMPLRAAEITAAVFPWALVLVAFGLLLALLRHARRRRQAHRANSAAGDAVASSRAALEPPALDTGEFGAYEAAEDYDAETWEGASEFEGGEPYEYVMLHPTPEYPEMPQEAAMAPDESSGYDVAPGPNQPAAEPTAVNPTVPLPRPSVEPDDASAQPPKAVIRPTEMQLRARVPRQADPAASATADPAPGDEPAAYQQAMGQSASDRPAAGPTTPGQPGGGQSAADQLAAGQPAANQPAPGQPAPGQSAAGQSEAEPTPPAGAPVTEPPTSGFTGDTIPRGELSPAPTADQPSAHPPQLDRPRSSPTPPS
jgi:hypothetical protein